jgi:hypothetical protein
MKADHDDTVNGIAPNLPEDTVAEQQRSSRDS